MVPLFHGKSISRKSFLNIAIISVQTETGMDMHCLSETYTEVSQHPFQRLKGQREALSSNGEQLSDFSLRTH
jgi:hypothetical protein